MKKTLVIIALVAGLALLLMPAATALADNGPHGNFSPTNTSTAGCAACHRAHTAQGAYLLNATDTYALCTSCHGSSGTGANTNVLDGTYLARRVGGPTPLEGIAGAGLLAGGFQNTVMNTTNATTAPAASAATSSHDATGLVAGTVWGFGPIDGTATGNAGLANVQLECTDCHNPHGMASSSGTATYRILRSTVNGVPYTNGAVNVADVASKWYTVGKDTTTNGNLSRVPGDLTLYPNDYFNQTNIYGGAGTAGIGDQISNFCSECHARLGAPSGAEFASSGDTIYTFRHPAIKDGGTAAPHANCTSCHVSHGSSAVMSNGTSQVYAPGSTTLVQDSALLRLDNRGVCAGCHANSFVAPANLVSVVPATGSASAGTVVTVTGDNLGATAPTAANAVQIGGVSATIVAGSWSQTTAGVTTFQVTVPATAPLGTQILTGPGAHGSRTNGLGFVVTP